MQHAKTFPPSGASAWMSCPAWESSDATHPSAAEGTRLHNVAERMLSGESVDQRDVEILKSYANYVGQLKMRAKKWFVEAKLTMKATGEFGTADFVALVEEYGLKWVHVVDLKTGNSHVAAKDNKQLMLYSLGALEKLKCKGVIVIMTIHQKGKVRSHAISQERLLRWQDKELKPAVEKRIQVLKAPEPTKHAYPSFGACFFCKHDKQGTCYLKSNAIEDELCELN